LRKPVALDQDQRDRQVHLDPGVVDHLLGGVAVLPSDVQFVDGGETVAVSRRQRGGRLGPPASKRWATKSSMSPR